MSDRALLQEAYAASTRKDYRIAVKAFLRYVNDNGEQFSTYHELDELLTDYIHFLFSTRGNSKTNGKQKAQRAVYGVCMFLPRARHHLMVAKLALRGWSRFAPPTPYPPLTWELTVAISMQLAGWKRLGWPWQLYWPSTAIYESARWSRLCPATSAATTAAWASSLRT